jgi:hypothetical protein
MNFIELDLGESLPDQEKIRLKSSYLFSDKTRENVPFVIEKRALAHT